jgi:hypothetical protein
MEIVAHRKGLIDRILFGMGYIINVNRTALRKKCPLY